MPPVEQLFFIGCFSNADDEGRLLGDPAFLRSTIFRYQDLTLDQVRAIRDKVVATCKHFTLYVVDDTEYLAFLKWDEYQKPRYPKPSKHPSPENGKITESLPQDCGNDAEGMQHRVGLGLGWDGLLSNDSAADAAPPPDDDKPPTNQQLIAELVAEYREIAPEETHKRGDYAFVGRLYNEFGYDAVLAGVNALAYRIESGETLDKPLVYLRGIIASQPRASPNVVSLPKKPSERYRMLNE